MFYYQLDMSADMFIESVLNLTYFGTEYSFKQLRKPVNKSDWISHGRPAIVNAFYSSTENSIREFSFKHHGNYDNYTRFFCL